MRWILAVLVAALLAGCGDDGGSDGDGDTTSTTTTGTEAPIDEPPTRDPRTDGATVSCDFSFAGVRSSGQEFEAGQNTVSCDTLIEPLQTDIILPFRSGVVEFVWDSAEPSVNEVGAEFEISDDNGTLSQSLSAAPGGAGGALSNELSGQMFGGSTNVAASLIFDGASSGFSGTAYVTLFETEAAPAGFSAA